MCNRALTWAFEQRLPGPLKFLLVALANMAGKDTHQCFPSQATLAEQCGTTRESICRQIGLLEAAGLIHVERRTSRGKIYTVRCDAGSHRDYDVTDSNTTASYDVTQDHTTEVVCDRQSHSDVTDNHTEPLREEPLEVRKEREAKASPKKGSRWEGVVSLDWVNEVSAVRAHYGLPPLNAELEADKFADYWDARNDAGAIKRDWHKTWLNWVRNAKSERVNGQSGQSPATKLFAGFAAAAGYRSDNFPADEPFLDGGRSDGDSQGPGRRLARRSY